jgi:hypothetical protein
MTTAARAVIDIKGQDIRSRHKPPAKGIDVIASGVPLAMNPDSSTAEHLARMGFEVASPLDTDRWLSREYWEETRRFGLAGILGGNPAIRHGPAGAALAGAGRVAVQEDHRCDAGRAEGSGSLRCHDHAANAGREHARRREGADGAGPAALIVAPAGSPNEAAPTRHVASIPR